MPSVGYGLLDFTDEAACRAYLNTLRWQDGFVCPSCGAKGAYTRRSGLMDCIGCKHTVSPTVGTIFQDFRLPVGNLFRAVRWFCIQTEAVTAKRLQSELHSGSYETAWLLLTKLRYVMAHANAESLSGIIEVREWDQSLVSAADRTQEGTSNIVIAVKCGSEGAERIRLYYSLCLTIAETTRFITDCIAPRSTIITSEQIGLRLPKGTYTVYPTLPKHLFGVDSIESELKSWIKHGLHRVTRPQFFDGYLQEFAYRFNTKHLKWEDRFKRFDLFIRQALQTPPAPLEYLQKVKP